MDKAIAYNVKKIENNSNAICVIYAWTFVEECHEIITYTKSN